LPLFQAGRKRALDQGKKGGKHKRGQECFTSWSEKEVSGHRRGINGFSCIVKLWAPSPGVGFGNHPNTGRDRVGYMYRHAFKDGILWGKGGWCFPRRVRGRGVKLAVNL